MLRDYVNLPLPVRILCLGSLINRAGSFVLVFLTIYASEELGFGVGFATACMGIFGLGSMVGAIVGGQLADQIGRRIVMLIAQIGGAALLTIGCGGSGSTGGSAPPTGNVTILLTDAPSDDFSSINVTISRIELVGGESEAKKPAPSKKGSGKGTEEAAPSKEAAKKTAKKTSKKATKKTAKKATKKVEAGKTSKKASAKKKTTRKSKKTGSGGE